MIAKFGSRFPVSHIAIVPLATFSSAASCAWVSSFSRLSCFNLSENKLSPPRITYCQNIALCKKNSHKRLISLLANLTKDMNDICYIVISRSVRNGGEPMKTCFRIRELRQKAGLTQGELARRVGLRSSSTVTMWESGERVPKSEILPRLSAELGCTIDELYGLDPPKQEANRPGA